MCNESDAELWTIAYLSLRAPGVSKAHVIDHIVLPGMRRNRLFNITGCLWFDQSRFVQVIEGEAVEVASLYKKISNDRRHTGVITLCNTAIQQRAYPKFAMKAVPFEEGGWIDALQRAAQSLKSEDSAGCRIKRNDLYNLLRQHTGIDINQRQ